MTIKKVDSHTPTQAAAPLWLPSNRRTQDPGVDDFLPSGSYPPGTAPCRDRYPVAGPGPEHAPMRPQNRRDSAVTMVTRRVGRCRPHLSVLLLERSGQTQHAANRRPQTAEERGDAMSVSPPAGQQQQQQQQNNIP